jgi:hypothetical protein
VLGIERFGSLEQIRGYGTRAGPASASSDAMHDAMKAAIGGMAAGGLEPATSWV